ncbi:DUF3999 domain-containing protein [Andreprevotia chitinilytica]|uniref:DUF3999 domain-containing protein n=1 Tax=Andreprevotia chitinilytica TaxID=396808 RepID=UPI00055023D0|nr:DUF3999 domain-containing protein [Andreprevotia chitinilytica]
MSRILLLLSLLAVPAWADSVADPHNFARHAELKVTNNAAVYQLDLPADVYRYVTRPDLGDVRVFNGAGEPVPYALSALPAVTEVRQTPVSLPFFPLPQTPSEDGGVAVTVQAGTDGALVSVKQGDKSSHGGGPTQHFIVDASRLKTTLDSISLEWREASFQGRVQIEASDDLRQWYSLASADVLRLEQGGQQLDVRKIDLGGVRARYLKLSWLSLPPTLQSVSVTPSATQVETRRVWFDAGSLEVDAAKGEYRFTSPAAAPIDRIRIGLPQPNTLVSATLLSRGDANDHWREVVRTQLYRLQRQGGEVVSGPLTLWPTSRREWMLRVDTRGGGLGHGQPDVQLGWLPQKLTFVARGNPPFTLAYGQRGLESAAQPAGSLQIGDTKPTVAEVGPLQDGTPQPEPLVARETLRRWGLWAVLIAAVLVLGLMAWRLGRKVAPPDAQ